MLDFLQRQPKLFRGLAVLGIVAAIVIAVYLVPLLSAKRTVTSPPMVLTNQQVLEESPVLFTVLVDETNIHYGPRYNEDSPYRIQGFGAGDDGTFWIIDVSARLLHYSSDGRLLSASALPKPLAHKDASVLDVKVRGSDVWILAFVEHVTGSLPTTLFKLSQSGQEVGKYHVPDNSPIWTGTIIFGENGEILLYEPSATPPLWQMLDSKHTLDLKPLEGYTRQGKLYSTQLDEPTNRYNNSATIQAGDVSFSIAVTRTNIILSGVCVCHVNPDGSFYLFTQEWDRKSRSFVPPEYRSILYYSADGTAIGRVPEMLTGDEQGLWPWVTSSWHEHLALRADGSIYLLKGIPEERGDTTHFEVRRLKFGLQAE